MAPITTWNESLANLRGFLVSLEDWSLDSPCPGWTVSDLLAHTIDLESMLAGDPRPVHEPHWQELPHISTDFGRMTEVGVDMRRGLTREELLSDLDATHERAAQRVELLGPHGVIPWLRGDTPVDQLLGFRAFDIWVHEQDARVASRRSGNLVGPGAENARAILVGALPKIWAKAVGAPRGSLLNFVIEEPGPTNEYWIRVGEDGKAAFVEAGNPTVSIAMPWLTYVMLGSGRNVDARTLNSIRIDGDGRLGQRMVESLAVTP